MVQIAAGMMFAVSDFTGYGGSSTSCFLPRFFQLPASSIASVNPAHLLGTLSSIALVRTERTLHEEVSYLFLVRGVSGFCPPKRAERDLTIRYLVAIA